MTLSERAVRRIVLALLLITLCGAAWAAAVLATGGFAASFFGLRLSSRNPHNPLVLAVLAGVNALALQLSRGREPLARVPTYVLPFVASAIAVGTLVVGVSHAAFVAGSSDAYGYISQADLWARGDLVVDEPLSRELPWPAPEWLVSPLGYRPATSAHAIVPTYSAGYPIVMAAFHRVAGPAARSYVVPLTAAGLVWCSFIIGRRLGGGFIGVATALLVTTSPPVLFQTLMPMSDVPAAFWWSLAVVCAGAASSTAHVPGAIAVAMAILTRPNLVPIAGLLLVFAHWAHRTDPPAIRRRSVGAVTIGTIVGAGAVAWINNSLYGSPLTSGYGSLPGMYALQHFPANIARYSRWALDAHTALFFLFLGGMIAWRRVPAGSRPLLAYGFAVIFFTWASYMFYLPFDNWTYLRFLLPAYPFVFAVGLLVPLALTARWRTPVQVAAVSVVCAVIVAKQLDFDRNQRILELSRSEERYRVVGEYINQRLPERAIVIGMQHSGSVRYYGKRATLRWDWLPGDKLDELLEVLERRGRKPYFVLEDWEEPQFIHRFGASSRAGTLSWSPLARFHMGMVRVYDPAVGAGE